MSNYMSYIYVDLITFSCPKATKFSWEQDGAGVS